MDIGYIVFLIFVVLVLANYLINKLRPRRLDGRYNTIGKVVNKIDTALGIKDREIVGVKYLGVVNEKSKRGGLGGAALGGFLFGPLGVPIGAMLPKGSKQLCRFAVRFDDGEVTMMDCTKGSVLYNSLISQVSWEDL